jgi:hypothetical protein
VLAAEVSQSRSEGTPAENSEQPPKAIAATESGSAAANISGSSLMTTSAQPTSLHPPASNIAPTVGSPSLQPSPVSKPTETQEGSLLINWPKRRREPEHLDYVRRQPCLICGRTPSDAHHLRFAQQRAFGRKVSDEFTVPLCRVHHHQLHQFGKETEWWIAADRDVDPLQIAKGLWEESRQKLNVDDTSSQKSDPQSKSE